MGQSIGPFCPADSGHWILGPDLHIFRSGRFIFSKVVNFQSDDVWFSLLSINLNVYTRLISTRFLLVRSTSFHWTKYVQFSPSISIKSQILIDWITPYGGTGHWTHKLSIWHERMAYKFEQATSHNPCSWKRRGWSFHSIHIHTSFISHPIFPQLGQSFLYNVYIQSFLVPSYE